jgi:hypothetical protein
MQEFAAEKKAFLEERQKLQSQGQPQFNQTPVSNDTEPEYETGETKALKKDIEDLRVQLSQVKNDPALAEVQQKGNRSRLSKELEAEGFTDFEDYYQRMSDYVAQKFLETNDPRVIEHYNKNEVAKSLYFQLKARDLAESKNTKAAAQTNTTERPKPPIIKVGSGTSSVSSENDDKQVQYKELFSKARKSKNEDDILKVMQMSKWE